MSIRSTRDGSCRAGVSTCRSPSTTTTSSRSTSNDPMPSHSRIRERGAYHVGPLARYGLNFEKLTPFAQEVAHEAGLGPYVTNPFKSIVVRAVEILYAVEEALRIIDAYEPPPEPYVTYTAVEGEGHGATEAPRGLLYHRYRIHSDGRIADAQIVPPTAQNQLTIESGSSVRTRTTPRSARRRVVVDPRTVDPELRPVHLVRHPLPRPNGESVADLVVIGVGNRMMGDDAVGPHCARPDCRTGS